MKNSIGNRIKLARENLEITQQEMADLFKITQSNYGRLEKDDGRISVLRLIKIAKVLKVSTEYLLHGIDKEVGPDETISTSDGKVVLAYFKT